MKYVVILSYPRSGSTLLQRIVNTASGFNVRGENVGAIPCLVDSYGRLKRTKKELPEIVQTDPTWDGSPLYGAHRINIDHVKKHLAEVITKDILAPPIDCSTTGWKENFINPIDMGPLNASLILDDMKELLGDVRFIVNTRNPSDTAKSAVWRNSPDSADIIDSWRNWLLQWASQQSDASCCTVDYDDFVEDPRLLVRLLQNFGIPVNLVSVRKVLEHKLTHLQTW